MDKTIGISPLNRTELTKLQQHSQKERQELCLTGQDQWTRGWEKLSLQILYQSQCFLLVLHQEKIVQEYTVAIWLLVVPI